MRNRWRALPPLRAANTVDQPHTRHMQNQEHTFFQIHPSPIDFSVELLASLLIQHSKHLQHLGKPDILLSNCWTQPELPCRSLKSCLPPVLLMSFRCPTSKKGHLANRLHHYLHLNKILMKFSQSAFWNSVCASTMLRAASRLPARVHLLPQVEVSMQV